MAALKEIKSHPDVVDYFIELPFYNKYIDKPEIKRVQTMICFLRFLL